MKFLSLKNKLPITGKKVYALYLFIIVLIITTTVIATLLGSVNIKPNWVLKILVNNTMKRQIFTPEWKPNTESIIWTLRMPRVFMALIVGAGLSLCGILMQALTKNSLADPYILGISSGASFGAVLVIMYGVFGFAGQYNIMIGASLGAIIAIIIAINVASISGKITATQLILAGIAVSALFGSFTNIMIYHTKTGSDKVRSALFWMIGSLSGATWSKTIYVAIIFAICSIVIFLMYKSLDALLLGDDNAITIGANLSKIKPLIIVVCTILTGAIVSVSGVIGFVGLIIPHITRGIVGPNHKRLVPASILIGGLFMIICDMISRTLVSPEELHIGIVTSVFGAPFFLYLVRKNKKTMR